MAEAAGADAVAGADGILAYPTGGRSDRIHECLLRTTEELLREGGVPAATVDAIAARSGVSKATIYKHWPCRTALAANAFGRMMADALPLPDTGSARGDLTAQVRQVSAFYASPDGRVFAQLIAACVDDPSGAAYFREYFLADRRRAVAQLWQRAVDRGETRPGIDAETATDLLFGPLVFRLLTNHHPLTENEADKLTTTTLPALLLPH
ncbi:TetR/AcrR family transcriptional regulator [Micromonospora sp. NPDC049523]|uniref:TetR/AcrR family transcriptional regulator n=1 Tax=Micromonospora sp. NPDC049523 TaxID=3155921 RepID=UPI0034339D53